MKIVAVDAAESPKAADIAGISTLPTLKLFISGKEIGLYEGDRTTEDMMKFIKNAIIKDEL